MEPSKLVAILCADIQEYSRHMREAEAATLRMLTAYRQEIDPLIQKHRGHIFNETGDGFLVEFSSAVDAVRCAVEIQQVLKPKNAQLPLERRLEFRIGINVGEVFVQGPQRYGDAINTAARLQTGAEAGGIWISGAVYKEVSGKLDLKYVDMGLQQVTAIFN